MPLGLPSKDSMSYLVVQGLGIWGVSDYGRQAVQAHHAAIQLCDPLLPPGAAPAARAALWCAIIVMNWARPVLPERIDIEPNDAILHAVVHSSCLAEAHTFNVTRHGSGCQVM